MTKDPGHLLCEVIRLLAMFVIICAIFGAI